MRGRLLLLVVLALAAWNCATKPAVPPATTGPRYPDFTYPAPPDRVGDERVRAQHQRAWQVLQVGDLRAASREFSAIVQRTPAFYPAAAGLGYVHMAEGRQKDALARFDQALRLAPRYAPALAGKGEALLASGQRDAALASFEAALAADASLVELRRRIDVLRFGRVRDIVAAASKAAKAGRLDEARRLYETAVAASPDSAFLYRDLGVIELRDGAADAAVGHLQQAIALDASDVAAHVALADALEARGDAAGALAALERAVALEPSDALALRIARTRERAELAALPESYRAIPELPQLTRGDLAALVGVRLSRVVAASRTRSSVVATDVRGHWAATWIMNVTRAGLMDVYPNHTFQPRAVVRRADLALVVSRVLAAAGAGVPRPNGPRPAIGDVGADHVRAAEIGTAVASGVLPLDGALFRPARAVSGPEAIEVMQRLERLTANAGQGAVRQ